MRMYDVKASGADLSTGSARSCMTVMVIWTRLTRGARVVANKALSSSIMRAAIAQGATNNQNTARRLDVTV